jgi:hypothetical protein
MATSTSYIIRILRKHFIDLPKELVRFGKLKTLVELLVFIDDNCPCWRYAEKSTQVLLKPKKVPVMHEELA